MNEDLRQTLVYKNDQRVIDANLFFKEMEFSYFYLFLIFHFHCWQSVWGTYTFSFNPL